MSVFHSSKNSLTFEGVSEVSAQPTANKLNNWTDPSQHWTCCFCFIQASCCRDGVHCCKDHCWLNYCVFSDGSKAEAAKKLPAKRVSFTSCFGHHNFICKIYRRISDFMNPENHCLGFFKSQILIYHCLVSVWRWDNVCYQHSTAHKVCYR